ncbi:GntR family transcriptional regulator [Herbidospora mongoliensis]|uniref:GntR family transcriptional regulator n=1 Tax=Herbidospora mongoliensis TaxID=688067 RepID=UPI000A018D02|nr:GntR family transcriptional regulator [Herbidospora mongoliensis]
MTYQQIAVIVRGRIRECEYPEGALLPSEATLCGEFGVARSTIRRALGLLEGEGLIVAIPAKGRRVKSSPMPVPYLYATIADDIRSRIRHEKLRMGDPVPSEAVLRKRYGVSRNTIRQALALLERDGLLVVQLGSGRFVGTAAGT